MSDDAGLGDALEELEVGLVVAEVEHTLNAWLLRESSERAFVRPLSALSTQFDLLKLAGQEPYLVLSVRVS